MTNQQIGFLFIHGWGGNPSFFAPLQKELACLFPNSPQLVWDRGYFGDPIGFETSLPAGKWIGIGHSFGLYHLLKLPVIALVSISGFGRFCSHRQNQIGTPTHFIDRMIEGLNISPQKVLKEFNKWAELEGAISAFQSINPSILCQDLQIMKTMDEVDTIKQDKRPYLSLGAMDDRIVHSDLIEESFANYERHFCENGGHSLGFSQSAWCALLIKEWLFKQKLHHTEATNSDEI